MFPAYPGFESLPLRVKVEWRGRKRAVVARLQQWPNSDDAVLVCNFDDEETGEQLIARGDAFWRLGTPHNWLCRYAVYDIATREPAGWSERGQFKLRSCLQRAFASGKLSCAIIYALPDVAAPNLVLVESDVLYWCYGPDRSSFVPFHLMRSLPADAQEARHQLESAWQDRLSDARFAWDWANRTEHEHLYLLTGYAGASHELKQTMRRVLQASSALWQGESIWMWNLSAQEGELTGASRNFRGDDDLLEPWNWWVRSHYFPDLAHHLRRNHPCVADLWEKRVRGIARVQVAAPTFHEQLEAKLWLRDWLQDKASPEQVQVLLAALEKTSL